MQATGTQHSGVEASGEPGAPGLATLTLLRHGESEWNRAGLFTGWADVDLSPAGVDEARRAGRLLARLAPPVDLCFTSVLRRAVRTTQLVLEASGAEGVPVESHWRLNERHYGALEGLAVWSAVRRHGPVGVAMARARYRARPPALAPGDPRDPGRDARYAAVEPAELPRAESVADTLSRLLPYWRARILPAVLRGGHVLVVSHKNTLRALQRLLHASQANDSTDAFAPPSSLAGRSTTPVNGRPIVITLDADDRRRLAAEGGRT